MNIKFYLTAFSCIVVFGLTYCEKVPDCEKENFGTITVTNNTGERLIVDCQYSNALDVPSGGEYVLQNEQSVSWNKDPNYQLALTARIYYDTNLTGTKCMTFYTLDQCETYSFSWIFQANDIVVPDNLWE